MANTVKILRSTTASAVPSSLASGQIAINEADGILYYRASSGAVTALATGSGGTSSLEVVAATSNLPATGSASKLYLTAANRLYRWVSADSVYAEVGAIGGPGDVDGGGYG